MKLNSRRVVMFTLLICLATTECSLSPSEKRGLPGDWRLKFHRHDCGSVWSFKKDGVLIISGLVCKYSLEQADRLRFKCEGDPEPSSYTVLELQPEIISLSDPEFQPDNPFYFVRLEVIGDYQNCRGDRYGLPLESIPLR